MSWNLLQPGPQAQKYTMPLLKAEDANSDNISTGTCYLAVFCSSSFKANARTVVAVAKVGQGHTEAQDDARRQRRTCNDKPQRKGSPYRRVGRCLHAPDSGTRELQVPR